LIGFDPPRLAGDLDVCGMRRLVAAQHNGRPAHSFRSDQSDLDLGFVGLDGDDRGDAGIHEIDGVDPPVWPFDLVSDRDRKGR
jgi:hypothetical protein